MYDFKVGEEVWDLHSNRVYKVVGLEQYCFLIQPAWTKSTSLFEIQYTTKDIIPLAIYNSPLYNALREEEKQ
jgi:hypothetical protein